MNHGSARTWVRTRRTAVLAALTLLVIGCGATGSPVDTTVAPTTTTRATTTGAGASATSTAPASTSVSPRGGLLATDPPHNAVQPFLPREAATHGKRPTAYYRTPPPRPGPSTLMSRTPGWSECGTTRHPDPQFRPRTGSRPVTCWCLPPTKPSWPANAKQRHPAQHAATQPPAPPGGRRCTGMPINRCGTSSPNEPVPQPTASAPSATPAPSSSPADAAFGEHRQSAAAWRASFATMSPGRWKRWGLGVHVPGRSRKHVKSCKSTSMCL
jgi:hypothetical protein